MNEKKNDLTWKLMRVDEIGDVISGGTPSTTNPDFWNGEIPFITPLDLSKNGGAYISNVQRYITEKGLNNSSSNLLPPNSLAISSRAPIGYLSLCKASFVTNQGCKSINFNKNQSPIFHYYNFQLYVNEMKRYGVGTTFSEISKGDLCRLKVNVPEDIVIQENIAQILTTCDKVIEQTEAVIAKCKAIKQGMLHDLFTRGLDKNGKLRPTPAEAPELYKESELGLIPKDWDVKHLNEVVDISVSNIDKKSYENEQSIRLCNYMDVYSNEYITSLLDFMNATANQNQINRFSIEKGDVIITKDSESPDDIGVPSVVQENLSNVVCGYHLALLKPKKIFGFFLAKQLSMFDINRYLANRANGSTRFGLTLHVIESMPILYPLSKLEQKLIFSRLQSIDVKIQAEEKILKKYKDVKTGLMNRLLNNF